VGVDALMVKAVFLDRDGVLNAAVVRSGRPYPPETSEEVEILPGVREALGRLRKADFRLIVVTNQPDVARGTKSRAQIEEVHVRLGKELGLEDFRTCFHDDKDACPCRKPAPGLLVSAAADFAIDLSHSYMVGDRWRDVEAGQRAGCTSIFVDSGYRERAPVEPFVRVASLAEAADWILKKEGRSP
jgi:D-glycero-D-manno-heptose 1,7-bisphosphate phosphatase